MPGGETDPHAWVAKADEDILAARTLLDPLPDKASFHVQQAIEKLLKAMIVRQGSRPPYVHALVPLRASVADELDWSPSGEWLDRVSAWCADPRYPRAANAWSEGKIEDVRSALEEAEALRREVQAKLA